MARIHQIELDLFARTSDGQEISLGTVEVPISLDIKPQPPRPRPTPTRRPPEFHGKPMTPEDFDQIGRKGIR